MKKTLILLFTICLIVCGCSKEEPLKPDTSSPTPTESQTITDQKEVEEVTTAETECWICGKITTCKGWVEEDVWNDKVEEYTNKTFYLCDTCYKMVEENAPEKKACDELRSSIFLVSSLSDNEILTSDKGKIWLDSAGLEFEGFTDDFIKQMESIEHTNNKIKYTYIFTVTKSKYSDYYNIECLSEPPDYLGLKNFSPYADILNKDK